MATRTFLGTSADFNATANWSAATVPVDGDSFYIKDTAQSLSTNIDQSGGGGDGLDPLDVIIAGTYSGSLGDVTNALKLDTLTGRLVVDVNGGPTQIIHLNTKGCPTTIVRNTGSNAYACIINGTHTAVYVYGGQSVRIGASATITTLYVLTEANKPIPQVLIEAGATVTTINASAGTIRDMRTAPATVNLRGTAQYYSEAASAATITALNAMGRSVAYLAGVGGTLTAGVVYDDAIVSSQFEDASPSAWTYTAVTAFGGSVLVKDIDTVTAATAAGGFIPLIAKAGSGAVVISPGK